MQQKWQETVLYGGTKEREEAGPAIVAIQEPSTTKSKDLRDVTWLEVDESWHTEASTNPQHLHETRSTPGGELPFLFGPEAPRVATEAPQEAKETLSETLLLEAENKQRSTVFPKVTWEGKSVRIAPEDQSRYEVHGELGEGGAGDVLLAKDNDIQRLVALKRLKKKWHTPPNLSRFMDEVRMMGNLEHPNIVPIHDVGLDDNGQFYFVMKYVEGQTMREVIELLAEGDEETHERFPFEVRNQIFLKILQAVQFAHHQGIIHRDIKPANIMIGPYGEVMVMDWGLAKQTKAEASEPTGPSTRADGAPPRWFETRHDTLLGTPAYMAPEQALGRNQDVDIRSDIYSLSALYYEWIGLQHYMSHKETLQELLFGIVSEEPILLAKITHKAQPNIPVELCHFVRKGMHKTPNKRFQDLKEMIEGLQKAMSGAFDVQCPITLSKRITHTWLHITDHHPLLSIFAFLGGFSLMLFGAFQALFSLVS